MHKSTFSYNISRPYPFKWFTPTVILGGTIVTILVSLISVATSGYELVAISVSNPNVTASSRSWLNRWPSFLVGSLLPTCDSSNIALNTELFTNNSALPYTLTGVWQDGDFNQQTSSGSLIYHNNPLHSCTISKIDIEFENMQRPARVMAIQQQGATLSAYVTCGIAHPEGTTWLSLSASYDYVLDALNMQASALSFSGRNATSSPSLWWGESMLAAYWIQLTNAVFVQNQDDEYQYYKGTVNFRRESPADPPNTLDGVKDLGSFFTATSFFLPFSGTGEEATVAYSSVTSENPAVLSTSKGGQDNPLPALWIPADTLAKTLYYTILTDLGQTNDTYPNILADPELLQYFTANLTSIYAAPKVIFENAGSGEGMATTPFDPKNSTQSQQLRVNPSTLNTNYLCQVPRRKAGASLVFSVLIADLVLLQTIWQVFKFVVGWLLGRRYPEMQRCEGCALREGEGAVVRGRGREEDAEGVTLKQLSPTKGAKGAYVELRGSDHEHELEHEHERDLEGA